MHDHHQLNDQIEIFCASRVTFNTAAGPRRIMEVSAIDEVLSDGVNGLSISEGPASDFHSLEIPELLTKILSWWSIKDTLTARLVCRKWRDILKDLNRCKDGRVLRLGACVMNGQIDNFLKSTEVFKTSAFWNVTKPFVLNEEKKFPCVLETLLVGAHNSAENVAEILKFCSQQVRSLIFVELSLGSVDKSLTNALQTLALPLLNELHFRVPLESPHCSCTSELLNHCAALKSILLNGNFPKLTKFSMCLNSHVKFCQCNGIGGYSHEKKVSISVPIYSALYKFICRHAKTVKSLQLEDSLGCPEKNQPWLGISSELSKSISENLKLESLAITYGSCLVLPCLMTSDKLSVFGYNVFRPPGDSKSINMDKLFEMVKRNQQNLVKLDLSTEHPEIIPMLEDLIGLPRLETLKFFLMERIPRLPFPFPKLIALHIDFAEVVPNWDACVIECFQNLERITVSDTLLLDPQDHATPRITADELNHLFSLKKIREITYGTVDYPGNKLDVLKAVLEMNPKIKEKSHGYDYKMKHEMNMKLDGTPEVVTTFFIPCQCK